MDFVLKDLIGFVVGTLIGMTGVGGGVLLLPVLIFGLRVPPILAVGSDALFNFFTKIGSGWMHFTHGTVGPRIVGALAVGSIPGSILGVSLLVHLRTIYGTGVNHFITIAVGILLVCIPLFLFFQKEIEEHVAHRPPTMKSFVGMSFGRHDLSRLGQYHHDVATSVLQLCTESHGGDRYCPRGSADGHDQPA